jgi:DNA-binding transcriptional LysR family regulator
MALMSKILDWDSRIGRRVRLRDLHILFAVVQHGSMAKAGAILGKSQSAVSQAIAAVEEAVGVRLLDRTSRGVEPTAYGSVLLRRGRAAFDELRLGVNEIECMADPSIGEVRIACSELVSAAILPPIIDRLTIQYPRISLEVFETISATAEYEDMEYPELQDRRVDVRIVVRQPAWEGETAKKFDAEVLCYDQICLAVGSSSPWARRRKIELADLTEALWVGPPSAASGGAAIVEAFRAQGLPPPRFTVTTFSVGLRSFLGTSGRFVFAVPVSVLSLYSDRFALKRLPIELPQSQLAIAMVTLKNRTLSPTTQLFMACAREVTKSLRREKG